MTGYVFAGRLVSWLAWAEVVGEVVGFLLNRYRRSS